MGTWDRAALLIKPLLLRREKSVSPPSGGNNQISQSPLPDTTNIVEGREGVVGRGATAQVHVPGVRATALSSGPEVVGGVA